MLRILLLQLLLGWSFFLKGQSAFTIYNELNSGLPQNTVRCLAVDASNNKWIGTDYGLAVFNESSWTVYRTDNSLLPENTIRALFIDTADNKWIGTLSSGLVKIDQQNNWTIYNTGNSSLPGNFVRSLAQDNSGALWIGTSSGLAKFDGTNWQIYTNTNSDLISHHISALGVTSDNTICIGTINGGLVYFKDSMVHYNLWNGLLPDNTVLSIGVDAQDNRYIAMPSGGLRIHYGGSTWQAFTTATGNSPSDAINVVYPSPNKIYAGSQDKGLLVKEDLVFAHYDSLNSDLPDVNVLSLIKDKNGKLWAGTMLGGLVKIDENILFSITKVTGGGPSLLNSLIRDGEALQFVGCANASVELYNVSGQHIERGRVEGGRYMISSPLKSGLYFITLQKDELVKTFRLIVVND